MDHHSLRRSNLRPHFTSFNSYVQNFKVPVRVVKTACFETSDFRVKVYKSLFLIFYDYVTAVLRFHLKDFQVQSGFLQIGYYRSNDSQATNCKQSPKIQQVTCGQLQNVQEQHFLSIFSLPSRPLFSAFEFIYWDTRRVSGHNSKNGFLCVTTRL